MNFTDLFVKAAVLGVFYNKKTVVKVFYDQCLVALEWEKRNLFQAVILKQHEDFVGTILNCEHVCSQFKMNVMLL